ncbi:hypothetical protein, conserved [Trypanosoma brucei gambiense DAL972]|uniref:T. brucei spp.-specific protein n=2 Tax=Trypanosoma brucei TaxID=5691 RepID=D0A4P1_TRYB9|nr:hypothetical protein, conserved [Trypanosoma brucei gambiense DAL972]RHW69460.1 hypothetical protein DPX39_100116600 [Trypanosoma brucei equiperdum]CBH16235.1 hypothetical protein, conserved [Trypanosoma brucei gambiense DAL972]|eukprot:XP_011778499.1 hypothetical protein, conserved [Trypanosoma brucei gambiense DAL972]
MKERRGVSQSRTSRTGQLRNGGFRESRFRVALMSRCARPSSSGTSHMFAPSSLPSVGQPSYESGVSSMPNISFPTCNDGAFSPGDSMYPPSLPQRVKNKRTGQKDKQKRQSTLGSVDSEEEKRSFLASAAAFRRHRRYNNPFTAYCLASDPYDRPREIERQRQFMSCYKRIACRFVAGGKNALDKPTRYMLGDCVARLYKAVAADWPEADPMVVSSAEDLIVVFMNLDAVRNPVTALRYMNALLKRCDVVRAFDLKKVPEGWDVVTEDGHLMYTFRPPWVGERRFLPDQVAVKKSRGR